MRLVDARNRLRLPLFHPKYISKSKLPKADEEYGQPSSSMSRRSLHNNNNNNNNSNSSTPRDNEDNRRTAGKSPKTSPRKSGRRDERRPEPEMVKDKETKNERKNKNGRRFKDDDDDDESSSEDRDVIDDDVEAMTSKARRKTRNDDVQKKRFSIRKWKQKRVEHNDGETTTKDNNNNNNDDDSDDDKQKTQSSISFKYHSSLHYGSVVRTKSRTVRSLPSGLRSLSFYSRLPRRQPRVEPLNEQTGKTRTKHETRGGAGKKTVTSSEKADDNGLSSASDKGLKDDGVKEEIDTSQETSGSIKERDEDEVQEVQDVQEVQEVLSNGRSSASFNELEIRSVGSDDDVEDHETRIKYKKKTKKRQKKKRTKKREEKEANISEEYAEDFDDDVSSLKSEQRKHSTST